LHFFEKIILENNAKLSFKYTNLHYDLELQEKEIFQLKMPDL